jgi:LPS export ABC transporter protein LptC
MSFKEFTHRLKQFNCINPVKWIKFGFLSFATCCILVSCENDIQQIKKFASSADLPKISAEDYEVLFYDSTLIKSKLQTPEMIIHDNEKQPYTEFPKGVKITQYDNKMKVTSFITSQYAKYFEADERWEAKNNVVAINQKGDTLKTEYLVWDKKKGKIYSNQFVKIIQKDQVSTGTSFESNQDFSVISLKNLKGQMYVDVQEK